MLSGLPKANAQCNLSGDTFSIEAPQTSKNKSELFAMGLVQFNWPRGAAENLFTKPGFWEHFVDFSQEKHQNTKFTKFSSVRTPEIFWIWFFGIGPDPASSEQKEYSKNIEHFLW